MLCIRQTNVLKVAFSTTPGFGLEPARKMLLKVRNNLSYENEPVGKHVPARSQCNTGVIHARNFSIRKTFARETVPESGIGVIKDRRETMNPTSVSLKLDRVP